MKRVILILFTICFSYFTSEATNGELKLEGTYQGENIYIQNPFAESGVGFCIFEVRINGQISTDEINSSAFEIDLTIFKFKIGDPVKILILHKDGCTPKILNPEVLSPKSTFSVVQIAVDKKGTLTWTTTGEQGKLPFIIEEFRWNKWIKSGTVQGKGEQGQNTYTFTVETHSGTNKFRVKQDDYTKKSRYSPEATLRNLSMPVTFIPGNGKKATDKIIFSEKTKYEIYDNYGKLIVKGNDISIDIKSFKKGNYFINYDNQTETFEKK